jgi:hypothetical protein
VKIQRGTFLEYAERKREVGSEKEMQRVRRDKTKVAGGVYISARTSKVAKNRVRLLKGNHRKFVT